MATTPDFLDSKRDEIEARLEELRPLAAEYHRLEAAVVALESVNGGASAAPVQRGTDRGELLAGMAAPKRGRPKGSGDRQAQALAMVRESPGITIPEIAARMGIKDNYLYRVLGGLEQDGLVEKDGRGWKPKG
jgi:hypothetical protein